MIDRPLITHKPSGLGLIYRDIGRRSKLDPLEGVSGDSDDVHWIELIVAIVGAVREAHPSFQFVRSEESVRGQLKDFLPLHTIRASILAIEESTFGCFY